MVSSVSGASGPGTVTFTYLIDPGSAPNLSSAVFYHDYMFHQSIFGFDFNGNRNGKIRFFINTPFGRNVIHIEDFDDTLSTPWSNAPAMSTRYEVFNDAAPTYRPSLLVSSETVSSEAHPATNPHLCVASTTGVSYATNASYPILGVALRAGEPYQRGDLQIRTIEIVDTGNFAKNDTPAFFRWQLLLNPTIGGTIPAQVNIGKTSRYWSYTTATTVTGGKELVSGYITSQTTITQLSDTFRDIDLGANIDYTETDTVVLVVERISPGTNASNIRALANLIEDL